MVEPEGRREIKPLRTTTYTLKLTDPDLEDMIRTVTVTVGPLPCVGDRPIAQVLDEHGRWRSGKGFSMGRTGCCRFDEGRCGSPLDSNRPTPKEQASAQCGSAPEMGLMLDGNDIGNWPELVRQRYESYLKTSFFFREPDLRSSFQTALREEGKLLNGPFSGSGTRLPYRAERPSVGTRVFSGSEQGPSCGAD